jgi:rubrerythrin
MMDDKKKAFIIDAAIEKEEEAYAFYRGLYEKTEDRSAKDALSFIAGEEKKHKEFLLKYKEGFYGQCILSGRETIEQKVAEHMARPDIKKDMIGADVYLVAAHREMASHEFYKGLAELHAEGEVKNLLLGMAQEELRHKEKMEYLYANAAFPQTDGG